MTRVYLILLAALAAVSISPNLSAAKPVKVEVLYMNHGPLRDTLNRVKGIFAGFGNELDVAWHDFENPDGARFKAEKGITRHVPLMIWIENSSVVKIGEREVRFIGFPTGAGPEFFQGKWTIDDLRSALLQATLRR